MEDGLFHLRNFGNGLKKNTRDNGNKGRQMLPGICPVQWGTRPLSTG